jgi:hypothetical protein
MNVIFDALSRPRMNAYRRFFGTTLRDTQIYGCYLWNESLCQSFFRTLTLIEIVLRNRLHSSLSIHYYPNAKVVVNNIKQRTWTSSPINTVGTPDSCNWYETPSVLNLKSQEKITNVTHHYRNGTPLSGPAKPTPDDVVSTMQFGFWSSLIEKNPNINWSAILGQVFPKHRATSSNQWASKSQQERLSNRIELLRTIRNRIAHHEPIWKLPPTLDETPVPRGQQRKVLHQAPTNPSESIARLREIYSKHTEFLRWMSPDLFLDLQKSSIHSHFLWLCSNDGLTAYINREAKMSERQCHSQVRRQLSSIIRSKQSVIVSKKGLNVLALHPI